MKLLPVALSLLASASSAFQVGNPSGFRKIRSSLSSTVDTGMAPPIDIAMTLAKTEVLDTANSLKDEFGCLLIDTNAQDKLRNSVEKLEAVSEPPSASTELIGEWTLLCSTASASLQNGPLEKINGIDTSKIPFFNDGPLKDIRNALNKSLKVEQIIKAETTPGIVSRVDHVLEYMPPDTLSEFLGNLPDALKSLNINPLQVSESKVSLIHKAEVESITPVIKIKLSLSSIVVNVAGKSQVLDPLGADVLGVNVPFGEFLNAGSFETTYMDDKLRISRSKVGIVDQLRVFIRSDLGDLIVTPEPVAETPSDDDEDEVPDAEIVFEEEETEIEEEETSGNGDDDISPSDY